VTDAFPEFITALPQPASPFENVRAWMIRSDDAMAMFYEVADEQEVPEHVHGAQWGVITAGRVDFTIGGDTRTYQTGDTYFIPAGVPHRAIMHPGTAGIDVFADADRYEERARR
jgi:quercetin dioxygenase-like cupin family protein